MVKNLKTINCRFQYFQWKRWKQELRAMKTRWHSRNINETLIYIVLLPMNAQGIEPEPKPSPSPIASSAPQPLRRPCVNFERRPLFQWLPPSTPVTVALTNLCSPLSNRTRKTQGKGRTQQQEWAEVVVCKDEGGGHGGGKQWPEGGARRSGGRSLVAHWADAGGGEWCSGGGG